MSMNPHDQIIMRSLAARIAQLERLIEEEALSARAALAEKDRRISELEAEKPATGE